jgi:hypothetical protein
MCWNAEVSLQSFSIGLLTIILAYTKGLSFPTAFFCLTITFMQLVEYFVWSGYNNFLASVAAVFLLWLQPVASILTLETYLIPLLLGAYIGLTFLGYLLGYRIKKEHFRMYKAPNGHLAWDWLQPTFKTSIMLFVYFFFLLYPLILSESWILLSLSLSTLGLSLWTYFKYNTWGSMWCWIVNYGVVGVSLRQIFLKSK